MKSATVLTSNICQWLSQTTSYENVDSKNPQAITAQRQGVSRRSIGEVEIKAPVGREEIVRNWESSFWTSLNDVPLQKLPRSSPSVEEENLNSDRKHVAARSLLGLLQLR